MLFNNFCFHAHWLHTENWRMYECGSSKIQCLIFVKYKKRFQKWAQVIVNLTHSLLSTDDNAHYHHNALKWIKDQICQLGVSIVRKYEHQLLLFGTDRGSPTRTLIMASCPLLRITWHFKRNLTATGCHRRMVMQTIWYFIAGLQTCHQLSTKSGI